MSIINQIIRKFPSAYRQPRPATALSVALALAQDKRSAFLQKYNNATDKVFRELIDETCCYSECVFFDFLLNTPELREFLREDLKSAEIILIESNRASALSLKQVERALSEARDAEEFKKLVLEEQASRADIWFELERRLEAQTERHIAL